MTLLFKEVSMDPVTIMSLFCSFLPLLMCLALFVSLSSVFLFKSKSPSMSGMLVLSALAATSLNMAPTIMSLVLFKDFNGPIEIRLLFAAAFLLAIFSCIGGLASRIPLDQITVMRVMSVASLFNFAAATWLDLFSRDVVCESAIGILKVDISAMSLIFVIFFATYFLELRKIGRLSRMRFL